MATGSTSPHFHSNHLDSFPIGSGGICTLLAALVLMMGGPLIWRDFQIQRGFFSTQCSVADGLQAERIHPTQSLDILEDFEK